MGFSHTLPISSPALEKEAFAKTPDHTLKKLATDADQVAQAPHRWRRWRRRRLYGSSRCLRGLPQSCAARLWFRGAPLGDEVFSVQCAEYAGYRCSHAEAKGNASPVGGGAFPNKTTLHVTAVEKKCFLVVIGGPPMPCPCSPRPAPPHAPPCPPPKNCP